MVTLINKTKDMITGNESPNSFSLKARLKSFRYAFEGLTGFFAAEHNAETAQHSYVRMEAALACLQ